MNGLMSRRDGRAFLKALRRWSLAALPVLVLVILAAVPAFASSTGSSSGDEFQIGQHANGIYEQLTGPVARLIAVALIIGGALMFAQSREMTDAIRHIAVIAIAIGLILSIAQITGGINGHAIPAALAAAS